MACHDALLLERPMKVSFSTAKVGPGTGKLVR
jgi:hypothetical protein